MTNNANTTARTTAHADCTHPRTKVARATCRKARAKAIRAEVATPSYPTYQANGSKVVHWALGVNVDDSPVTRTAPACTRVPAKAENYVTDVATIDAGIVTCKNCVKKVDPTSL